MKKQIVGVVVLMFVILGSSTSSVLAQGGVATVCNPVKSVSVKANVPKGETGLTTVDMSYSVSPCDKNQAVRVEYKFVDWYTKEVVLIDENAPLSAKVTYFGAVKYNLYQGQVTVYDAVTGEVLGTGGTVVSTAGRGV